MAPVLTRVSFSFRQLYMALRSLKTLELGSIGKLWLCARHDWPILPCVKQMPDVVHRTPPGQHPRGWPSGTTKSNGFVGSSYVGQEVAFATLLLGCAPVVRVVCGLIPKSMSGFGRSVSLALFSPALLYIILGHVSRNVWKAVQSLFKQHEPLR